MAQIVRRTFMRAKIGNAGMLSVMLVSLVLGACNHRKKWVEDIPVDPVIETEFDGRDREYILHVGTNYSDSVAAPLVFIIHGGGGDHESSVKLTLGQWDQLADEFGFIVCYPNGIDKQWNDGREVKGSEPHTDDIDDVGFFRHMIEEIEAEYNIDSKRIFATGISNGGFMSNRLACDLSDRIAAIAPVVGGIAKDIIPDCNPANPVAVLIINGTEDELVPYDGEFVETKFIFRRKRGEKLTVDSTANFWVGRMNCASSPATKSWDDDPDDGTSVELKTWTGCDANSEVQLYKVIGGGHTWPQGWPYLGEGLIGKTSQEFNANFVIWEFFKSHPKP